jgi:Fe-S cluster assembly ATP-binding protein
MPKPLLELRNVHAEAEGSSILRGVDLVVNEGEVHALMGPNGAGKSTLASVVMGHPGYRVTNGEILLRGEDISSWTADTRARAGIFLAFQYPEAISGVSVIQFLRQAIAARKGLDELSVLEVRLDLAEWMERLGIDSAFAERHLNDGFSGGERKRNEVLQMALLEPVVALLDETDSGLDIDALRVVAKGVRTVRDEHPTMGAIVVTHYVKLLDEIRPDFVHILVDGRIVHTGGAELAEAIDRDGYDAWRPVNA